MRLADLKRFVEQLLPDVYITSSRRLPSAVQGMAWLCDGEPVIVYAQGMTERERDLTILHEAAHHLFDMRAARVLARRSDGGFVREQWREDRADRWAEQTLELLEIAQ